MEQKEKPQECCRNVKNEAPHVFCDNNLAIFLYKNDVFHHKIKLIDTIYHFIRELVSNLEKYV